ncbi:MAG TPA: histidine kinase, partial [Chitinophagaceae bacterium]|nr:histidine kinase [Chitinophagaceae bacterium]
EVELDTKIVDQLDQERQHAEMNVLKNELDPHFIFNSLTALAHLVNDNTDKAKLFIQKLAQAYKYLLMNKDREIISLNEELQFLDNYFFLLQIRHDHKLKLEVDIDESRNNRVMILPCALQILIENAIKHNQFTEAEPLVINISLNGVFLNVSNNVRSKPYMVESTNIGLKNLSTRYKLTCNKDIVINRLKERFIVKLPIIQ